MAPRTKNSPPTVIEGVTISRTLPPALPDKFISRKHLFRLIIDKKPGATIVIAPAGYGKTSLIAEWAQHCNSKVIWTQLSNKDSLDDLAAHMIQSVKNVIPEIAPWANSLKDFKTEEIIQKTANELYSLKENFVWVLDSADELQEQYTKVREVFIESIPNNVHIILISRKAPNASYSRFAITGNLNLITVQDLIFNSDEIKKLAKIEDLDLANENIKNSLESARGWPAAVQLLIRKIQHQDPLEKSQLVQSNILNSLTYLVDAIMESIKPEDFDSLIILSMVNEFDLEIAELLLDDDSTTIFLNRMTQEGIFISSQSGQKRTYHLNPIIRESLQSKKLVTEDIEVIAHKKLVDYFLEQKKIASALSHAYQSGDRALVQTILKNNIRTMAATGKGDFLLEWSKIIGENSASGYVRRLSLQIAAHVVNLNFEQSQALIEELRFGIEESDIRDFLEKSASVSSATIAMANGEFHKLDIEVKNVLRPLENTRDIENIDKLHVLRLLSNKALAFEDYKTCIEIYSDAQQYLTLDYAPLPMYYLNSISACASFAEGNYFEAFDIASAAIAIAEMNDYKGISGPSDLHFLRARCLLEFSRKQDAIDAFELVRTMALSAKQKAFYVLADGYLLRQMVLDGWIENAFDGIKEQRVFLQNINSTHQLDTIVDANEAFLRFVVKDYERVLLLLERMPEGNFVTRFKPLILERLGKKAPESYVENLPANTPREILYKLLAEIDAVLDRESEALGLLRKCLDLAALNGARETLLRQKPAFLNLIIKASGERPTVYLEELARAAALALKKQDQNSIGVSESLTKREIEILKNLSTGKPISSIGSSLHVSQNTMKTHLRNIYRKLEVDGRHSAVEKAKSLFLI